MVDQAELIRRVEWNDSNRQTDIRAMESTIEKYKNDPKMKEFVERTTQRLNEYKTLSTLQYVLAGFGTDSKELMKRYAVLKPGTAITVNARPIGLVEAGLKHHLQFEPIPHFRKTIRDRQNE